MFSYRVPVAGLVVGLLFAVLDGVIHANPVAQRLYTVYQPIARKSIPVTLGVGFDFVAGIVMAYLFMALLPSLPGGWITQGAAFGLIAWFFRVAMGAASQVVMFRIPAPTVLYGLLAGLVEMVALGVTCSALLRPR